MWPSRLGYQLTKAGVMLLDPVPDGRVQGELPWDEPPSGQRDRSRQ